MSRPAKTHYSHDRGKTVFTSSDVDPVPAIDFVQATRPVPDVTTPCFFTDNLPAILHADSAPCSLSLQRLAHSLGFDHARAGTSDGVRTPAPAARFDNNDTDASATNTGTSDSSSNNAFNIARTLNADIATNNNGNIDNTASFVDTTCTLNTNAADSRTPF